MRRDAVANRERIIDTAEVYFAENGLDAPMHALASAAKVGTGTLYRNFASQEELWRALYARHIALFDEIAERALEIESGWEAIQVIVDGTAQIMIDRRIVAEVMRRLAKVDPDYRPTDRWVSTLQTVAQRAVEEGMARPDLTVADLSAAPLMLSAVQTAAPENRGWLARRMRTLLLDGMRAHPHEPSPLADLPPDFYERGASIVKSLP
ncbi:TetR/AcrR family transcriptional regulator [Aeromicrobium duanguangcaii]|uniref:TetR/AcrR family transcriptional regulator n=1 Tax=Aeromicrobium duanguangcaii TaxID=2968086 RepID=UPI002017100C|nr:TetR/AcrR family transcriptional regulator [Aeromicrobium duanguangcaii]MCL3837971.1 TetR/AcrR family transcriptional regulator [Aeromicrobium duanguangcaii]